MSENVSPGLQITLMWATVVVNADTDRNLGFANTETALACQNVCQSSVSLSPMYANNVDIVY